MIAHTELVCVSETDGETGRERESIKPLLTRAEENGLAEGGGVAGRRRVNSL